jgi:hypothetical protein
VLVAPAVRSGRGHAFRGKAGNIVPRFGLGSYMETEVRSTELKIRIRPSLKAAIDKAAKHDGRSISNWIERVVEEALKQHPTTREGRKR